MALVGPHHVDRSSLTFYLTTILALVAKITSTSITTTLATTVFVGRTAFSLAIVASVYEIFALAALLAAVGLFLRRVSRNLILAVWIPGTMACLIGSILAIATMSSAMHLRRATNTSNHVVVEPAEQHTRDMAGAGLAAAVVGLIPQAVFWAMIWPRHVHSRLLPSQTHLPPNQQTKRTSISFHLDAIGVKPGRSFFGAQYGRTSPMSPSLSHFTVSGRSSLRRDSASESLRPMTSKTRLIFNHSFGSRSSRGAQPASSIASHHMCSTDEFENWDTSRVKNSFETTYQKRPAVSRLEPIPGSRPVSPAHALDGPFTREAESDDASFAVAQSPGMAAADPDEQSSLRNLPRLHTRASSTAPSLVIPPAEQQHIHPLFRIESPAPPPLTSPGTVITASPYAGQIFSPEFALHSPRLLGSRDGSRSVSPALLSPSKSCSGSVKSSRTVPPSPIEGSHEPLPNRTFTSLAGKHSRPGTPLSPNG